jgi:hypothetical protein
MNPVGLDVGATLDQHVDRLSTRVSMMVLAI